MALADQVLSKLGAHVDEKQNDFYEEIKIEIAAIKKGGCKSALFVSKN